MYTHLYQWAQKAPRNKTKVHCIPAVLDHANDAELCDDYYINSLGASYIQETLEVHSILEAVIYTVMHTVTWVDITDSMRDNYSLLFHVCSVIHVCSVSGDYSK